MDHRSRGAPRKVTGREKAGEWKTTRNEHNGEGSLGVATMASPSVTTKTGTEAVVFSIQFYGKTIGEVGLLDQDLSELDWTKFKSYIFQNLLSVNHQENICVSYSDDEGDKLPIESEEEYREALKVAKKKAEAHDKLVLDITRQGSFPTVFSMVSSGIKRVSSSPPKEGGISFFKTGSPPKESSGFVGRNSGQDRKIFPSLFSSDRGDGEISSGGARPKEMRSYEQPPKWFNVYMSKFREELCEDVVTKLADIIREELHVHEADDKVEAADKADEKENVCKADEKEEVLCESNEMANPAYKADEKEKEVQNTVEKDKPVQSTEQKENPQECSDYSYEDLLMNFLKHEAKRKWGVFPQDPEFTTTTTAATLTTTSATATTTAVTAAESSTQENCFKPPQLKVSCSTAYNNFLAENYQLEKDSAGPLELSGAQRHQRKSSNPQKSSSNLQLYRSNIRERANTSLGNLSLTKEENAEDIEKKNKFQLSNPPKKNNFQIVFTERRESSDEKMQNFKGHHKKRDGDTKDNMKSSDSGVKRKKSNKEDERFNKWLEKVEEKMAKNKGKREERLSNKDDERFNKWLEKVEEKMTKKQGKIEERFSKKHEKLDERLVKKQEKLAEIYQKHQEKVEKRRSSSNRLVEMEKGSRAQGKVLAKMEGLRKKQACTPEEVSKLRKVVDKHRRVADIHYEMVLGDQRHLRRSERKSGCLKAGKSRKIDIGSKQAHPVDASLLHKALLELEALAEDSPSKSHNFATLGFDAFYVNDITYPDGSQVQPGAQFVKTWRVLNSGRMPWNEKTELCKWTQVQFQGSPVDWKLKPLEKKIVCPPLKAGECGNISITFIAPDEPGWYATHWRFCQQGYVFGNQIWCAVYVSNTNDSDPESHTKAAVNKTDYESAQGSTEEENEEKDCEEQSSTEEEESEEDVPNFVDAAKEVNKVNDASEEGAANPTSADILEPQTESSPHEEEQCLLSEYEVGIIENYYDAEDPAENTQCVEASGQDNDENPESTEKLNSDLITFEEEAELIPSASDVAQTDSVVLHSVMPLKDMARESVDTLNDFLIDFLKDSVVVKEEQRSQTVTVEGLEDLSFSSGSFSDLDSEDQAILNESDTDASDQDYYVVPMPECFDLSLPYSRVTETSQHGGSLAERDNVPEVERHDSPDFLTADEDDRTTAATCLRYQDDSLTSNRSTVDDNEPSSSAESVLENTQSTEVKSERSQSSQQLKGESRASLPLPPAERKGFMDIPPEALRTNLAITLYKENSRPEGEQQPQQPEPNRANWSSGSEERQVVCEQPVSAQAKAGASPQNQSEPSPSTGGQAERTLGQGTAAVSGTTNTHHDQLRGDGAAAALPDELVSIIPEDLVRGVWNTARTFITRINQEMLSPSANGPQRGDDSEGVPVSTTPPLPTQESPKKEERRQEPPTTATPEGVEEPPSLPPPLQQLADMGFSNHEVNQCLLTKYNNDVACAVAELIVLNCQ